MREIIHFEASKIELDPASVLDGNGTGPKPERREKVLQLAREAREIFDKVSQPRGIFAEISIPEFEAVYMGDGRNESETPLASIFRRADHMALFAVTIGEEASGEIAALFRSHEFALGYLLDSIASEAADMAAQSAEEHYYDLLERRGLATPSTGVLGYSPGYCGWHVSGQKKLFEYLRPEEIGITLRESFLMQPLKSVSGVLVAGKKEIHDFDNDYAICDRCREPVCQHRILSILEG